MAESILASSGIYAIRNVVNGKMYVGSAINIQRRWSQHKWELVRDMHHSAKLQSSWNKHGEEAFVFYVIEMVQDVKQLISREQHWIDSMGAYGTNGYNMRPLAGSSLGSKESEKSKALRRAALTGRKLSPEHCAKISAGLTGKIFTEERKANISAAHMGKKKGPMSAEARARLSATRKGKKRGPPSEATREILSRAHIGKKTGPPSAETREKISIALKECLRKKKLAALAT